MVVERTCERCGAVFAVKPYRVQQGEGRFCSLACWHATTRERGAGTLPERFWSRVDRSGEACWLWTGATNRGGYGKCTVGGRTHNAHRVAWELTYGPVPPGLMVMHLCDVPRCCRPSHLVLGSAAANMTDMALKGRSLGGERNPSRLHPERLARGEGNGLRIHPQSALAGERNPAAKLTAAQVRQIRVRYAAGGITQRQLAAEYGVAQSQVWSAIRGKRWTHVA